MISMDKQHTFRGESMTVVSVATPGEYPVLSYNTTTGEIWSFKADGSLHFGGDKLIEVIPYSDYEVDELVMVNDGSHDWESGHFAGVHDQLPTTWAGGTTSWTSDGKKDCWCECRRPTAHELLR